jgi:hypothetical protein
MKRSNSPRSAESALALLGVTLFAGCARVPPPLETTSRLETAPRRPDAVAVDPTSAPPPPRTVARSNEQLVTLRAPLGLDAARRTVRRFFEAVAAEDIGQLSAVASPTALVSDTRGGSVERMQNLGFLWRQRFAKLDYTSVEPGSLYREAEVETFEGRHGVELPAELRVAAAGEPLEPEDVVMRVRILAHGASTERLFGNTLTFWLRRDEDRYVVSRLAEDVPL